MPTLRGMHVAFASEFGRTASDVGETSGPYAAALAAELVKPGLSHLDMFQNVKESVAQKTGGSQVPWELNGLSQRVHLAGPVPAALPLPPTPKQNAPQPEPPLSAAAREWQDVKASSNRAVLEAFRARHQSDPVYSALADDALSRLPPDLRRREIPTSSQSERDRPDTLCEALENTTWRGRILHPSGRIKNFLAIVRIDAHCSGRISYPDFPCESRLRPIEHSSPMHVTFQELIVGGSGCVNGFLVLSKVDQRLKFDWSATSGGRVVASGMIDR